jgi:hypothetical protein
MTPKKCAPNRNFVKKRLNVDILELTHLGNNFNYMSKLYQFDRGSPKDRPQKVSSQLETWFARDGKKTVPPNNKFGQKRLKVDNLEPPHVRRKVNTLTKLNPTDRGQTIDSLQNASTQNEAWFTPDANKKVPQTALLSKND